MGRPRRLIRVGAPVSTLERAAGAGWRALLRARQRWGTLHYNGFQIPRRLAALTGGSGLNFAATGAEQAAILERFLGIEPDHAVLEIGCGVGKSAIPLTGVLSPTGRYAGVDIIRDSIRWCDQNITPRHPNFAFHWLDVHSHVYNPRGGLPGTGVRLPALDHSIDRIFLFSVFTHMLEPDIRRYLSEFARVLKPHGRVLATWFIADDQALLAVRSQPSPLGGLRFEHQISDGCYVNKPREPLRAVAYTLALVEDMVEAAHLKMDCVERGYWSGVHPDQGQGGQDIAILRLQAS